MERYRSLSSNVAKIKRVYVFLQENWQEAYNKTDLASRLNINIKYMKAILDLLMFMNLIKSENRCNTYFYQYVMNSDFGKHGVYKESNTNLFFGVKHQKEDKKWVK